MSQKFEHFVGERQHGTAISSVDYHLLGPFGHLGAMDKREAKVLFERCLPRFLDAGLQSISDSDR